MGPAPPVEGLIVSGEATARAAPDIIELIVNLQNAAPTATQALRDSALLMQKMAQGHAGVQNLSLAVTPLYNPAAGSSQAQAPTFLGYQVTNAFKLVLRDISQAGMVLDAASGGAAQINCALLFRLNDESLIRREVLEAAAREARKKAESLAAAVGKQVGDIALITEDVTAPANPNTPADLVFRARVVGTFRLR